MRDGAQAVPDLPDCSVSQIDPVLLGTQRPGPAGPRAMRAALSPSASGGRVFRAGWIGLIVLCIAFAVRVLLAWVETACVDTARSMLAMRAYLRTTCHTALGAAVPPPNPNTL
jgi:hypothetical protein